jgi:hypothetical protein
MNSLVKVPPYSKLNFQGKNFFTQNWCNITLTEHSWTPSFVVYLKLKSTCDVNLFSKLSIISKEWRITNNVDRGRVIVLFVLYILYTDFFFVTRLIINKINKVQWVDFKLENVLVSLHSLKTMGLSPFGASAPLFLRNGELLGHSPILDRFNGY